MLTACCAGPKAIGPGRQRALKHALLTAYHGEGRNPSDPEVLLDLAGQAGLDVERARQILAGDEFAREVREREQFWQGAGIQSVPAIVIDRKHLISGGQPPEVFEQALRQIAALPQAFDHQRPGRDFAVGDAGQRLQLLQGLLAAAAVGGMDLTPGLARHQPAARGGDARQADPRVDGLARPYAPATQRHHRQPQRTHVAGLQHAGARGRHVALHRRAGQAGVVQHIDGAAQQRHHARKALGGRAAVECAVAARRVADSPHRPDCQPPHHQQLGAQCQRQRQRARVACRRARSGRRWRRRTSSALPALLPSTWFMSVTSAAAGSPAPRRHAHQAARQFQSACAGLAAEGTAADLDVQHQALQPGSAASWPGCWR
jgi:hypothetical protein